MVSSIDPNRGSVLSVRSQGGFQSRQRTLRERRFARRDGLGRQPGARATSSSNVACSGKDEGRLEHRSKLRNKFTLYGSCSDARCSVRQAQHGMPCKDVRTSGLSARSIAWPCGPAAEKCSRRQRTPGRTRSTHACWPAGPAPTVRVPRVGL